MALLLGWVWNSMEQVHRLRLHPMVQQSMRYLVHWGRISSCGASTFSCSGGTAWMGLHQQTGRRLPSVLSVHYENVWEQQPWAMLVGGQSSLTQ